jgi:ribosome biogenesis GTPase / thiamine phosphate phosphatase
VKRRPDAGSDHRSPIPDHASLLEGQIVACHGRRHRVELADGSILDCVTRGRQRDYACGDRVDVARKGPGQGVIEALHPRTSLLYRSDRARQKMVAANVTRIVIVVAPVPTFYPDLVNRCLAAAEHGELKALILLNKSDLPQAQEAAVALEPYRRLGYPVTALSAKRDAAALVPHLRGTTSVLVGQSGMGKSTLINALLPDAQVRVAEVSTALDSGRHTTTHARLYHLDAATHIIDSPGLQEFGLHHLDAAALESAFVELRPSLGHCRFRDCRHMSEPGCAVAAACERGEIAASRLESYRRLVRENASGKRYD